MLREPQKAEKPVQLKRDKQTGRFQIVKLEERIAPAPSKRACHVNPQGKLVGPC